MSILAEPPVAVVDEVVDEARHARRWREAYLEYLYTPQAQEIAAKHYYRPTRSAVAGEVRERRSRRCTLFTIDEVFGGWAKAQKTHFADGGVFDQIYRGAK